MGRRAREKYCPVCGKRVIGRGKYCGYDCSSKVSLEAAEQVVLKEGPYYEKWKKAMEKRFGKKVRDK